MLLGHSEGFDSVSKPLILLCWQGLVLVVPLEIAQWLLELDAACYTIVCTPHAQES